MKNNSFKKWLALSALFAFMCFSPHGLLRAQSTANYAFTTNTSGSLGLDMNGNVVDMTAGTTQLVGSAADATVSSVLTIGFNFSLMGNSFTQFSASADGFVGLGATAVSGTSNGGASIASPKISAMGGDLYVGASGKVHYKLVGTAPNRCLVVEFNNMAVFYNTTASNAVNTYQVRLYETSGVVEFVYGNMYCGSTTYAPGYVGFSAGSVANTNASVTTSSSTVSTGATFNSNSYTAATNIANLHSTVEGSRRVYRFTPPAIPTAPSSLTFTGVGASFMTLNWVDNSTTEYVYNVARSLDGVTYTNVGTLPANSTAYSATGLTPNTLYYWNVTATSELGTSTPILNGSQSTSSCSSISGIKTVGAGGDYLNLTTAFADINACSLAGNTELQLIAGYPAAAETYPITGPTTTPVGAFTLKVYPTVSGLSITSNNTTGTLNLNNSANLTIDGRVNQTGANDLIIANTNAGTSYAVQFINDAHNCNLINTIIQSTNTSTSSGSIVISTTTGTNGNDNITIDNCDIRDGATQPANAIYAVGSTGTAAQANDNVVISNNRISNFFSAGNSTIGVYAGSGNNAWTISNNKLFQTASRTYTTANTHNGIQVNNTSGNGFVITGNTIGYANSTGTGVYTMAGTIANRFIGINVNAGTTTASSVQGNTISGINLTTSSGAGTGNGILAGINITGGNVNVGNLTPNIIGSGTGTGSIVATTSTAGGLIVGINNSGSGTVNISNNVIGSITALGSTATQPGCITGIQVSAGTPTINTNTIGSTVTANSINASTVSTGATSQLVRGIDVTSGVTTATSIQFNTIANMNQSGTSTGSFIRGISYVGTGVATINQNTVYNISGASANTTLAGGGVAVQGILHSGSATAGAVVSKNIVYNIAATNTGSVQTCVAGIACANMTTGSVSGNKVYDLRNASTMTTATTPPVAAGIIVRSVVTSLNVNNNMISLGNAEATNTEFVGIWNSLTSAGPVSVFHNSVSVSGTAGSGALPSFAFLRGDNSATAVTSTVDIRNNILSNTRTGGTGKQYAIGNQGSTASATGWGLNASNYNALNAAPATIGLWGPADQTFNAWRVAASSDANSVSGVPVTFTDITTANLHLNMGVAATALESGGTTIASVTTDFDNDARPGPAGSVNGGATAPDLGADEFDGVPAIPVITLNSVTPPATAQCVATARVISVNVNPTAGTTVTVNLGYTVNGVAQTPIAMTNPSGSTWTATIPVPTPANATITWAVTATNSMALNGFYTGTTYSDEPLFGSTGTAQASISTSCAGSPSSLSAKLTKPNGVITLGAGSLATTASGSSSVTNVSPFSHYYGGYKFQYVVRASELTAAGLSAGNITALSFDVTSAGTTYNGFAMRIAPTANTDAAATFLTGTFTDVFSGNVTPTVGLSTITFSTPFNWDGTSNIVIQLCWSNNNGGGTAAEVRYDATPFVAMAHYNVDTQTPATVCGAVTATATQSNRPKMIFRGVQSLPISSVSWSDGVGTVGTANPLTVNPTTTTTYTATITASGCAVTPAPTTMITVNPLPAAPTATNSAQCGVQIPTANVTSTSGLPTPTFNWYAASSGGSALQSSTSTTYTTSVSATTTFYVSELNSVTGCESTRTPVTVTVSTPDQVSLTPSAASVCLGGSFTLTAANINPIPFQSYTYSTQSVTTGSGAETPLAGAIVSVTPTAVGSYVYTLTATDGGCAASATATVTVNPVATLSAATAAPATVCSGDNITVSANIVSVSDGPFAIGAGASTGSGDYYSPFYHNYGGVKEQFIIRASELTAAGFTAGDITSVALNIGTVGTTYAGFTIHMGTTASTDLSAGLIPTASLTPVYSAATLTLTPSSLNTYTLSAPFAWNGTSNLIVQTSWSNNNGGGSSSEVSYDNTAYVSTAYYRADNQTPAAVLGATTASATRSSRPKMTFAMSHNGLYTWSWAPGTGLNTPTATTSITNTSGSAVTQAFTVTATNIATGCAATATTPSVTINSAAPAPVANNSAQCGTMTPTVSVTGTGTPGNTFSWYLVPTGGTAIAGQTGSSLTAYPLSATTTFYVAENNGTCSSPRTPVTVTVTTPPAISISGTTAICNGGSTSLTVSSTNDPNYTYTWSGGLGTGGTVSASPTVTTTYTVTATDASGGANNGCVTTGTHSVAVNPNPTSVVASVNDASICNGESINLTSTATTNSSTAPVTLLNQNFDSGLGTWTTTYSGSAPATTGFAIKNAPYTYDGITDFTNFATPQGGGFMMSNADMGTSGNVTRSTVVSPVFSTAGMNSATLTFQNLYYKFASGDSLVRLEISTNGGTSWATLKDYFALGSQGVTTSNAQVPANESITLTAPYLNQANLRLRYNYVSAWGFYWLIDNVKLVGTPVDATTYAWTSTPAGFTSAVQNPTGVAPTVNTNYSVTVTNSYGCSASGSVAVTVNQPSSSTVPVTACDTYTWPINNATYTTSGTHTAVIPNAAGCDSTITLNLTIKQSSSASVPVTACDTYTWPINNATYTTSGTHTATIMNAAGCDSVITLNLTINHATAATVNKTACMTYTWPLNSTTYNTSGVHTATIMNAAGCDSVVTLNLTIGGPSVSSVPVTNCGPYVWAQTGLTYNTSGAYNDTIPNMYGCDSVITLNLTINQPSASTLPPVTRCTSYTWPQNGTMYTVSGLYTDTIANAAGCDSVITLDLTIIQPTTSSVTISECTSYTWPQNGTTYLVSGSYNDTIPNAAGCDSIITLNLTIKNVTTSVVTVSTCMPTYTWAQNGTVYNASGSYNDTIANAAGCDSIITLNLTITPFVATATDNGNATITASAGTTYQWINCTTHAPIAGATTQTFTATANGTYAAVVSNGTCSDTTNCVTISNVGIKENMISTISVHPNPTHDVVIVTMDASSAVVEVMDVQGKLVQTTQIKSGDQVDLSAYERGVYTLRIKTELGTSIERIVKN